MVAFKSGALMATFACTFLSILLSISIITTILSVQTNAQRSSEQSSYNRSYSSYSSSSLPSSSSISSGSRYSSSFGSPSSSLVPSSRFRSLECRSDVLPQRAEIVPHGVVFTGTVNEVRQDGSSNNDNEYSATVTVKRVFFGPRTLRKSRVTVTGFGDRSRGWCHSNVRCGDTWLFVLVPITYPDYFRLNASLIRMNLHALEKMEGIIADEPYRRLTSVEEYPCEKKYCKNNANCIEDKYAPEGTKCECLNFCKANYAPVLASNNETYSNECEVRLKSCYAGKNWFLKSTGQCQNANQAHRRVSTPTPSVIPSSASISGRSQYSTSSHSPSSSLPSSGSSSYSYSYRSSDSRSPPTSSTSYTSSSSSSLPILPPAPYSPHRTDHTSNRTPDTSRTYSRTVTTNTITRSYAS